MIYTWRYSEQTVRWTCFSIWDGRSIFVELNFRKCKLLLFGTCHTPSEADIYYFDNLNKAFDTCSSYERRLLIGDFNMETSEPCIDSFVYEQELQNLVKEKHVSRVSTNLVV